MEESTSAEAHGEQQQQQCGDNTEPSVPPLPSTPGPAERQHSHHSEGRISPRMREQDADLLEVMHYAASQVSQYSPDGTPLLRPQDRSLPMEDVPLMLMPMASTSELLMKREDRESSEHRSSSAAVRTATFTSDRNSDDNNNSSSSSSILNLADASPLSFPSAAAPCLTPRKQLDSTTPGSVKSVHFPSTEASVLSLPSFSDEDARNNSNHVYPPESPRKRDKFRRLLSGEVRSVPDEECDRAEQKTDDENQAAGDGMRQTRDATGSGSRHDTSNSATTRAEEEKEQEEGETTASPVSVFQEAATAKSEQDEGLAERRRMNEAIQFAQAVGEEISINRDDLCIIEDNENDDDDDDDDEDEAIESKEIIISSDLDQSHELTSMSNHQYQSLPPPSQQHDIHSTTTDPEVDVPTPLPSKDDLPKHVDVHSTTPTNHHRRKSRPMWPFEQPTEVEFSLTEHLPGGVGEGTNFVYHGICSNPPEVTKRGIQRGNYAQLHRKAWLEVSDKYHRYGKNLRLYYRYWERLGFPTNRFFDWLDSKGEAAGQPLPNMEECPRSALDSDTVLYIANPKTTDGYALDIIIEDDGRGRVIDVDGDPVLTGSDGWIFVLRDNMLYGAPKITSISGHSKQRFHHSSFFGGKAVASAGIIITDEEGYLTRLYPHSGHYRPGEAHMQRMLLFIHRKGVDLRTFEIDMQQLSHVSREKDDSKKTKKNKDGSGKNKEEKKVKKVDNLLLARAVDVACFLAHKADFIGKGIFDRIHKIRKADATSVTEALELVDNGGYWKAKKQTLRQDATDVEVAF